MMCILLQTSWTDPQVIVQGVAAIGIVITLVYSMSSFTRTLRDGYYAELDRVYFDLLKIVMERPYLADFAAAPDPNKQREYDVYAYMVWNFIETIYDRCQGHGKEHLRATWYPIVESENGLHRDWFNRNRPRFKASFCTFIEKEYPAPRQSPHLQEG